MQLCDDLDLLTDEIAGMMRRGMVIIIIIIIIIIQLYVYNFER